MHARVILFVAACATKTVVAAPSEETSSAATEDDDADAAVGGNGPADRSGGRRFEAHEAHALYADASCAFAEWTMNRLFAALSRLDELDRYRNAVGRHRDERLVPRVERSIRAYGDAVDGTAARFVHALHAILEAGRGALYYSDKTVLKTLVSLRIKSRSSVAAAAAAAAERDEPRSRRAERLRSAVRLLLADMTALQSYRSMNCPETPSADRAPPPHFFGFAVDGGRRDVRPYLTGVARNAARSARPRRHCTASQTMWRTFVPPPTDRRPSFLRGLSDAEFAVADDDRRMTVRDVLLRVEQSYEPDAVFWYQSAVFDAIVEALLARAIDPSRGGHSSLRDVARTAAAVENFYRALSRRFDRLPPALVDVATNLYKAVVSDDDDAADDAVAELWERYETVRKSVRGGPADATEPPDVLEEILTTIADNAADFECYQMNREYLHGERERAYVPFADNREELLAAYPAADGDESESTCAFLLNTYTLCFHVFRFVDLYRDRRSAKKRTRLSALLSRIKNYFLVVVKNRRTDVSLRKMSYTVATILVNLTTRPRHVNYINNVRRILEVIMNELNISGLKYCTGTTFNFLLFNNIDFDTLGTIFEPIQSIESSIKQFLIKLDGNLTDDHIDRSDSQLDVSNTLSLKHLNKKFIKRSNVFRYYNKKILFYWKGTSKTTKTIYKNLTFFAANPLDLNAFYDIYFKFYITAVYYEIRNFLDRNENNEERLKNGFNIISDKLYGFASHYFPNKLEYLISDIQELYLIPQDEESTLFDDLHKRKEKIDEELKKLNIIIETKSNKKIFSESKSFMGKIKIPKMMSSSPFSRKTIKMFSILNSEIRQNVSKVNSYFLTYGR